MSEEKKFANLVRHEVALDRRTAAMLEKMAAEKGLPADILLRRLAVQEMRKRRKKTA